MKALAMARRERPDLMFLDIEMPKIDGIEVCRALKGDPNTSSVRIVMLTALPEKVALVRSIQAGADGYVTKPFRPAALLKKMDEVLDSG